MNQNNTLTRLKAKERKLRQKIIIDAAREVFGTKTYDKVSMAEIAKSAGIAKSSIYTYFNSQEELYATIACMDSGDFIKKLKKQVETAGEDCVKVTVSHFLEYYIKHKAQWRMITHFALHGSREMKALDSLNQVGRMLMDLFESIFKQLGCQKDSRILAHTLFACLSGILIAFRNYPGRTEAERIAHMKRIGAKVEAMIMALVQSESRG